GVFKSTNAAGRWQAASAGLAGLRSIRELAIDPRTPSNLFAATGVGVYASTDAAATWVFVFGTGINTVAIDPGNPNDVFAGFGTRPTASGGLFRSGARGAAGTWNSAAAGIRNLLVESLAASPTTADLYAGVFGGIFKTQDRGQSWQKVLGSGAIIALALDPSQPTTVYAGTLGFGVFKTTNGGGNWAAMSSGLVPVTVFSVAIDPSATATVY